MSVPAASERTGDMSTPEYFEKYENLAFSRDHDGVLVLRFHTNGGPVVFTGQTHSNLTAVLEELSLDNSNKALVITGTGDSFMDQIDGPSLGEIFKPAVWEKIRVEGAKVLQRLLDLPMPVVGVANGPATVHSEYLLLADVHIASERATYGDLAPPYVRDHRWRRAPRRVGGDRGLGAREVAAVDGRTHRCTDGAPVGRGE